MEQYWLRPSGTDLATDWNSGKLRIDEGQSDTWSHVGQWPDGSSIKVVGIPEVARWLFRDQNGKKLEPTEDAM